MKFAGELKFPDLDHPGVPVDFLIEGNQAELTLEGESLGRWSLYDVRADRLIASAFQVDLAGTEITFVADDPIDFAYRGVEHMAKTWAGMKAKRMGSRGIAVNRSRKGTVPSRIGEVRAAMEQNLDVSDRPLAGEPSMPQSAAEPSAVAEGPVVGDWDRRDQVGEIPTVGGRPTEAAEPPRTSQPEPLPAGLDEGERRLEEERRALEQERAELARQKAEAEQREANLFEAYRLEMERLEREREELRLQAADAVKQPEAELEAPVPQTEAPSPEPEPPSPEPEPIETPPATAEPAPASAAPPEEPEPAQTQEREAEPEPSATQEPAAEPEPRPQPVGRRGVLDLNEYEDTRDQAPPPPPSPVSEPVRKPEPVPPPEPALAGAAKERGGLMGAVRAAFRGGAKDHTHHFIEAPGGIGITRYVCEECGYVSISADN